MQLVRLSRAAAYLLLAALTSFLCGCASNSPQSKIVYGNPAPSLSAINPAAAVAGNPALTLTITGLSFESTSTVMWNGAALTTTYSNGTTLTAQVPASDLVSTGTATVTVVNPAPGGGTSGQMGFTIQATANPDPSLSSVNPNIISVGSPETTITATGSNFVSSSTIMWNGAALTTSYVNATTLTAQVPATDLANTGTATVTVVTGAPGGGTSNSVPVTIETNPVPTLSSISPNTAAFGSAALTLTATGTNFVPTSTVLWNGAALTTSYTNTTTLTAQVPATDLASAGTATVTVSNPAPGGGTSSGATFTINPGTGTSLQVINVLANSLAWDPVNQVIYLSLPSTDATNGNSVQILNPTTGTLGNAVFVGSEPNLLAVSATSQFLYVSQNGASTVQVLSLPNLTSSSSITLGSDPVYGPFYAMDLQAAPNADGTVAVVQGAPGYSPEEEGGVWIYDSGTARTNVICGWIQTGCSNPNNYLMDSIQWNSDGTEMFAQNYESTSFDFYTLQVSASGFGAVTDYPNLAPGYFDRIHYDVPTGYVYSDCGCVINPSNGTIVGSFAATGLMVPDGTLGAAFFLGQTSSQIGTSNYTLESFNISTFTATNSVPFSPVTGTPTALIRWGANGLAFISRDTTQSPPTGAVYIINGAFVSDEAKRELAPPAENVQRTWKPQDAFHKLARVPNENSATK
jgi:trimeric autotransporter adhesin